MVVRTLESKTGSKEHIVRPHDSALQMGTDWTAVFCGHTHLPDDNPNEYKSVDDIEKPCYVCLRRADEYGL